LDEDNRAAVCLLVLAALRRRRPGGNAAYTARTEVWKDIAAGKAGSAAVAIMAAEDRVFEGFGMADADGASGRPAYDFQHGLGDKVYVATAIMLLVDEGKVDLDQRDEISAEFTMADERYKESRCG
jgi:CubicO group peptidase (beta-lactamase class C family)